MSDVSFDSTIQQDLEVWKPIPGYEEYYEVSTMGRVRTLKKSKGYKAGHILRKQQIPQGYCYARLSNGAGRKMFYVHRLVLMTFDPLEGYENLDVNHKNGARDDNRLSNLEWLSHRENMRHSIHVLGTFKPFASTRGNPPSTAKMTPDMVREIRAMAAVGVHYKEIAKSYPMTPGAIHHIIMRRTWKNVD